MLVALLRAAVGGAKKTNIMHDAHLNWRNLEELLELAYNKGLIEYGVETRIFRTTGAGLRFCKIYEGLEEVIA